MRYFLGLLIITCPTFHSSSSINGYQKNESEASTASISSPHSVHSTASSSGPLFANSNKNVSKQLGGDIFDNEKVHDDFFSENIAGEVDNEIEESLLQYTGNFRMESASRSRSRNPCNIERIDLRNHREVADRSEVDFVERVITDLPDHPVIFVGFNDRNALLSRLASMGSLMTSPVGDSEVKLTSSNTYSSGLKTMTLKEYIHHTVDESARWEEESAQCNATQNSKSVGIDDAASCKRKSNESFYLFGGNYGGVWDVMRDAYKLPPCLVCAQCGAVTIGIGGHLSGVSFHHHGPGFSEVIEGSKRWFLFPPPSLLPLPLPLPSPLFPPPEDQSLILNIDLDLDLEQEQEQERGQCTLDEVDSNGNSKSKSCRGGVSASKLRSRGREMFDPNMTVHEWVQQIYPSYATQYITSTSTSTSNSISADAEMSVEGDSDLDSNVGKGRYDGGGRGGGGVVHSGGLQECTTGPGEMLYFPAKWMHATLNMSPYNVFVSLFIDLQLLR